MQEALGEPRRPLPFARDPVTDDARLIAALAPALDDLEAPLEDLQRDQVLAGLAAALAALDRTSGLPPDEAACFQAIAKARDFSTPISGRWSGRRRSRRSPA